MSDLRPYTVYLSPDEAEELAREGEQAGRSGLSAQARYLLTRRHREREFALMLTYEEIFQLEESHQQLWKSKLPTDNIIYIASLSALKKLQALKSYAQEIIR